MTVKKARSIAIVSSLIVFVGYSMASWFFWAKGMERWLALIGFTMVVIGCFAFLVSLTRLIFPISSDFRIKTLFDKHTFSQFKKAVGSKKANAIGNTCSFLCFLFAFGIMFTFYITKKGYEKKELDKFGQIQKVRIKKVWNRRRNNRVASFNFYIGKKTLSSYLYHETLRVDDSATIIFSTNNPDIVKWLYDYEQWK